MSTDQIIVTIVGLLLIAFVFWFFFMKREEVANAKGTVEILVNGGYKPQIIAAEAGKELTLTFLRKDPSLCLEEVVLSDFGIRRYLPLHEKVNVTITPTERKEYYFACGMNMYQGKIIAS